MGIWSMKIFSRYTIAVEGFKTAFFWVLNWNMRHQRIISSTAGSMFCTAVRIAFCFSTAPTLSVIRLTWVWLFTLRNCVQLLKITLFYLIKLNSLPHITFRACLDRYSCPVEAWMNFANYIQGLLQRCFCRQFIVKDRIEIDLSDRFSLFSTIWADISSRVNQYSLSHNNAFCTCVKGYLFCMTQSKSKLIQVVEYRRF